MFGFKWSLKIAINFISVNFKWVLNIFYQFHSRNIIHGVYRTKFILRKRDPCSAPRQQLSAGPLSTARRSKAPRRTASSQRRRPPPSGQGKKWETCNETFNLKILFGSCLRVIWITNPVVRRARSSLTTGLVTQIALSQFLIPLFIQRAAPLWMNNGH